MNRLVNTLLLLFISMPVLGESWLCESEYSAQVWHKNGEVQGAAGDQDEEPLIWRVDAEGVRDPDGRGDPYIVGCNIAGKRVSCSSEGDTPRRFTIDSQHVFTLIGISIHKDGTVFDFIFKGTCKDDNA
jgi:hypothetical protein